MASPLVQELCRTLRLPVIGSPMFILSQPELVLAQCTSGIMGAFPALNARPAQELDNWLNTLEQGLAAWRSAHPGRPVAPYAVNQIIHPSNERLEHDMQTCARHRVPFVITSLRAPQQVVGAIHGWGGRVLHDVTTVRHAEKALEAGVDGLILVCAGAGGHAGTLSPFALVEEIRRFYDGPLVLAGAIGTGRGILAAQALGADLVYMGTRFIAAEESHAAPAYKQMVVQARAADIVYTPSFTGIPGNYLRPSIQAAGLDPDELPAPGPAGAVFGSGRSKAWRDIWGAGQGVGHTGAIEPVSAIVDRLEQEYLAARHALAGGC
ncbi:nitronate monooxygenase family protein [Orrella sp. JC864]|uniref:NAD(P)H-dependent flavin oxidoreductase n=1 Tax=Orrella sp. JC864 TaxID=3120298 RepID=UPI003009E141